MSAVCAPDARPSIPHPAGPPDAPRRPSRLDVAAAMSCVVAGLGLAVYALTAFTTRDWTVAGPGLAVAAAGVIGLRARIALLVGLVPIAAVLSVAGRIVAYDLQRPDETVYFVGSVVIVVGACFAAVLGATAVFAPHVRRAFPVALAGASAFCAVTFVAVIAGNGASAATDAGISEAERRAAVTIEMIDYDFLVSGEVPNGGVVRLTNTGELPHQLDVPEIGLSVFVPSGRDTYLRLPSTELEVIGLICPVGDHQQLGMGLDLPLAP